MPRVGARRSWRRPAVAGLAAAVVTASLGAVVVATAQVRASHPAVLRQGAPLPQSPPTGQDVAWPQCPSGHGGYGLPMPAAGTPFSVVGLTAGRGFTTNPCLAAQVAWLRLRHIAAAAYLVPNYPTAQQVHRYGTAGPASAATARAHAYNVGYAQGKDGVRVLKASGMHASTVWIDVEPVPGYPWAKDHAANAAVVRGVAAAIRSAHLVPGLYTNSSTWVGSVGRAQLKLPEWRTVGGVARSTAVKTCRNRPLNGGTIVMVQYWTTTVDSDVICRVAAGKATARWFTSA